MTTKLSASDTNDIIKLYSVDKLSINAVGKLFGIGYDRVRRILINNAVEIRANKLSFDSATVQDIISAYNSGIGYEGIPDRLNLNCTGGVIKRILRQNGVNIRNRSEQQQARMNIATPEERKRLAEAANKAARGRTASTEEKLKRAATIEANGIIRSDTERAVFDSLNSAFDCVIPQKAVHIYNVDFCVGNVTVEVFGGGWSTSDTSRVTRYIERTKQIGERGFHTIFVVCRVGMGIGDCSNLIAAIDELRSNPTPVSQYRVIWGDRYGLTGSCSNLDDSAFICPTINAIDPRTGRYISVPK